MVISPHFSENGVCLQDVCHVPRMKKNSLLMSQLIRYKKYVRTQKNEIINLWRACLRHMGYKKLKVMMETKMHKDLPQLVV